MNDIPFRSSKSITSEDFDKEVVVKGWVQEVRNLGGISFLILRDRFGTIQVTAPKKKTAPDLMSLLSGVARESVVSIRGVVKQSAQAKAGFEIIPLSMDILSAAMSPLPMGVVDKVSVEMDTRFNNRFMDLRKPENRAIFEIKSLTLRLLDEYMLSHGFVEMFTPKIVASGAEGGASLFEVKYFDKKAYLAQSPQLYKQMMMATGLDRVYEIGPAFRAELSDTVRHVSEFISFDAELAFIESQRDVMDVLEGVTHHIFKGVAEKGKEHLEKIGATVVAPRLPYPVITYSEALDIVNSTGMGLRYGDDLGTEGEKILGDIMAEKGNDMYWIVEYPEESKPFYIMEKEGTQSSFSFDLDYKGQEMASGGQREHRYDKLVARMEKKGLVPKDFEFYLSSFAYGMPPHGGFGLGIERLIVKMLGLPNIREAILFPRDRNRLVP
ncbi:MAG: aspartate--tRNA(Asn) ligase [Methanomassiliicoccales archaeon]|nr:MAG: aspartate--tRNA(Asn) ligase [Methanomassiliicoccales archaeon]